MPQMNYLGSGTGAQTMPAAVPGAGQMSEVMGGMPAQSMSGAGMPGLMPSGNASPDQYAAVTQGDGSILLHLKNPDGSLGPAVKIIEPIKPRQPRG